MQYENRAIIKISSMGCSEKEYIKSPKSTVDGLPGNLYPNEFTKVQILVLRVAK